MKQLEQEAHRAAGQIFLVTSNTQLRTVCTLTCTSVCCMHVCVCMLLLIISMTFPSLYIVRMCECMYCMYAHYLCTFLCYTCMFQCYGFVDIVDLLCLKVLFEKLCLHKRCENKKLPKTINKQQQSTSEAAVRHTQAHTQICRFNHFNLRKNSSIFFEVSLCALTR